jgi:hypothetical protein
MPRLNDETRLRDSSARNKGGNSIYSGRKLGKVTDESKMLPAELEWAKSYAAVLKAVGYSYPLHQRHHDGSDGNCQSVV